MRGESELFNQIDQAVSKKENLYHHSFWRYALRCSFASLFLTLGTAVAFMLSIRVDKLAPGIGGILFALIFSWSLIMIMYMNAELGTSNMMYLSAGVFRKKIKLLTAFKILGVCILFNLIGCIICGWLMSLTLPYHDLPSDSLVYSTITTKLNKTTLQILVEGIFANIVVNIAVIVSMKIKEGAGKIIAIVFIIFIFAFLGFEHVIANFATFSLGFFTSGGAIEGFTFVNVIHNLFWALIGNFIGGGLIIGVGYAWLNKKNQDITYLD